MLTAITFDKEGKRCLEFAGGEKVAVTPLMDKSALDASIALVSVDANREIYLHDNTQGTVDIHVRSDGNAPPPEWWLQEVLPVEPIDPKEKLLEP